MRQRILFVLLLACSALQVLAQQKITGTLVDKDSKDQVAQATVQLLKTDSSFVGGTISGDDGRFSINVNKSGRYLIKLTCVGYPVSYHAVTVSAGKNLSMGEVTMKADAVTLKGTTVTAIPPKVVVKADTFVYNSAAYRTPEGSVAEELVKRIPGATVDDDGNVTINGKKVSKVKIDGKEFMTGDSKTALKNLPTSVIDRIKAYDEKSDLSRVTGIDDGNEQTVLDFNLKRGMNHGLFSNIDAAAGNKDRYALRGMGAWFKDKVRVMGFGNLNNTNDRGFGGRGGRFGGGQDGLTTNKMGALNFNYEDKGKLILEGSVNASHRNTDKLARTSAQNFLSDIGSFNNSLSQSYGRSNNFGARMRLEWTPDTMTNIMFRPQFSYSSSDSRGWSNSASYNDDPYNYVSDPLSKSSFETLAKDSLMVNTRSNSNIGYSDSRQVGGMLQINRKLNSMGRNVTLRADASYSTGHSKSLSTSNVHLYLLKDALGNDSTYQTNRFNLAPTKNWSYSLQTTYSEPLWRATFLQFSYQFNYSFSKSDRSTYDFSNLGEDFFGTLSPLYRGWDSYLNLLPLSYESYRDEALSRYSEYKNYTHNIELMFRMIRSKYTFNAGLLLQPQMSKFIQRYQGRDIDTVRHVSNFSPTLDFRYRFSKVSDLRVNYRGSSSQPSMSDLVDITDDSDPLNITKGNPGLRPSFTHNLRAFYNNYIQSHFQFIRANLNYSQTRNGFTQAVTYNRATGGRTTRTENVNGNWNAGGDFIYNASIDTAGVWNVNTWTNVSYNNLVGYLDLNRTGELQKNITHDLSITERLAASYRNSWFELELDGSGTFRNATNKLQAQNNLRTWQFAYGGTAILNLPWGMSLASDLHENSRRGYSDNSMNTNELIWNLQLSQSFLKGKPLTVSLQFRDLLNQQSTFSRSITAMQRSDTETNSINSYAMLHVIYRVNLFGSKEMRDRMHGPGPRGSGGRGGRGGFRGGRPPMGPPPGGGFGGPR